MFREIKRRTLTHLVRDRNMQTVNHINKINNLWFD